MGELELKELFVSRARAVAARVSLAADEAEAKRIVADDRANLGESNVGVVQAALGIAETGTCVVETDGEEERLATMLPEANIILLRTANIVRRISEIGRYLRERQIGGKVSYTSLITGPSRTADIERVGAIGVHGPLDVHIILMEG